MAEFLQSYGIWIFVGALFLALMVRGHGRGMGCGMGGHEHGGRREPDQEKIAGQGDAKGQSRSEKHGGGCH